MFLNAPKLQLLNVLFLVIEDVLPEGASQCCPDSFELQYGRKVAEIGEADGKVLFRQKVRAEVSYTKEDRLIHLSALRRWCVAHRGWKDIGRTS